MIRLVEWLLDLQNIQLARDAPLSIRWARPAPAWALFCFALVAATVLASTYRRERTTVPRRSLLLAIRALIVALVVAAVCQPMLVLQRNRVEPSYVAMLLDTSMSMAATDAYLDEELADHVAAGASVANAAELVGRTRLDLVRTALLRDDAHALRTILSRNALQLGRFDASLELTGFAESTAGLDPLVEQIRTTSADGARTDLGMALRGVLERSQGRRLAAIVLASDGQTTHDPAASAILKDAVQDVSGRQIPIHALRIGSPVPPLDVEIGPLRAVERAFVNDVVAVGATLSAQGVVRPTPVRVRLIDDLDGSHLAEQIVELSPGQTEGTAELRTTPRRTGIWRFRVEAASLDGELVTENNSNRVDVNVVDERMHVLYVDSCPRYEYRYLKNALLREKTMDLSVLLTDADEQFVQEGTDPIRRFPETPEELNRYDVVFFGDVDPRGRWLTTSQMNMLLDFIGNEGGGFALIAGERAAPQRFAGTPLEKLVPVVIDPSFSGRYDATLVDGFRAQVTPEGRQSRIFRFLAERQENDDLLRNLPDLYWIAKSLGPKPGAAVLLEHPTLKARYGSGDPMPLAVVGRYGAGKIFFQATDDTWRWRRHTGEFLHDAYWVQVARELMRGSRLGQHQRFTVRTDRRSYRYGEAVRLQVEVLDAQLLQECGERLEIDVTNAAESEHRNADVVARFDAARVGADSNLFEGSFVAPRPGSFGLRPVELAHRTHGSAEATLVRVDKPDLEARRPEADHDTLRSIAEATGGRVIDLDAVEAEFAAIRDRSVRIPDDVEEPLWDSRLMLLLFMGAISAEWTLRKLFDLL